MPPRSSSVILFTYSIVPAIVVLVSFAVVPFGDVDDGLSGLAGA